jgi:hypothetical protein
MPLLLGLVLLAVVILLARWYAAADVKALTSSLKWTGIFLGLLAVAVLAVTGRLGIALALLGGLVVWAWRVFNMVVMIRAMAGHFQHGHHSAGGAGAPPMDEAEAWRVLGLAPGASADAIKAAHRRLMAQLHPDVGGSDYLAGKINAARDLLLRTHR